MDSNTSSSSNSTAASENSKEVLVVVSKLKNYIRDASGMNTSSSCAEVISELVRSLCNQAIERAKNDGRKTVMDRDFQANA